MKSSVLRSLSALSLLAALGACAPGGMYDSMFGRSTVAQSSPVPQSDEAPVPNASPAIPVQTAVLPPQPMPPQRAAAPAASGGAAVKVAILLPLSGENAELGKSMLNAAQMAVFDMSGGNFELMPRDTGSTPVSAQAAARDAVSSGAQLLIGPLFAAQVPAVHAIAESANINILTLSTDTSLAAPGVFIMGFAPGPQVERVVAFAAQQGARNFAAIVPSTPYGNLVGKAFRQAVGHVGGGLVALETYDASQRNSATAVTNIANSRDHIDALFLPEGGPELERLAAQLANAGIDPHRVHIMGTGLWDEPDLGQRAAALNGGWYAASDPAARQAFLNAYIRAYNTDPPRLATLAYDATALAAVLARRNERLDRSALTNPNGFAGVDGIFRLSDIGLVERGLAVNQVTPQGDRVVSPAPVTFTGTR